MVKTMKKFFAAVLCITLLASALTATVFAADTVTATPTSSKVTVDGKSIAFGAYNIGGSNYFKLRDIAYALNGTEEQFDLEYYADENAIILKPDEAYTRVGGEMAAAASGKKNAVKTSTEVWYCGGDAVSMEAYNIDGANYFKLRDLGRACDFSVEYDAATNTIIIDTNKPYIIGSASDYESLTQAQRLEILGYDGFDIGNPWKPYSADYIYGFLAWYANDQYGLDITTEDVEEAIGDVYEATEYDGVGEHPLAGVSRFYHVCVQYGLYPTQEMRENMSDWRWTTGDYLIFGEKPTRAKGDSDSIDDYYKSRD